MNNMGSKNYLSLSRKIGYGHLAWLHNSHCNVGLSCILPLATLILILMENNLYERKKLSLLCMLHIIEHSIAECTKTM